MTVPSSARKRNEAGPHRPDGEIGRHCGLKIRRFVKTGVPVRSRLRAPRLNVHVLFEVCMYRVWYGNRWIENVPVTEALVYKEEGHVVQRMDLPYTTRPT